MHLSLLLSAAFAVGTLAAPVEDGTSSAAARPPPPPPPPPPGACKKPIVRKEWRTLTKAEKASYISAVKCLQAKKPRPESAALYEGVKSRYDDFLALHIKQTDHVHWAGLFLPWHRHYLHLYEQDLRDVCCYKGGVPYWDWAKDAAAMQNSPIWDPETGFGGNGAFIEDTSAFPPVYKNPISIPGRTGGGCVTDGPWANHTVTMGPGNTTALTERCLRRDFSPELFARTLNSSVVSFVMSATNYFDFEHRVEGLALGIPAMSLHGGGHLAIGGDIGDMSNTYTSPGDPIFWAHHSMLDRVWDQWQRQCEYLSVFLKNIQCTGD